MPVSFANVTPTAMELTPARITYNGVDLGGSLGNIKVNVNYDKADIKADQFGTSVLDRVVSGLNVTIETELAEYQNKDILKVVFPNVQEIVSGGNKANYFVSKVGEHDLSLAHALILHPLSKQDADLSGDWKFYQAVADGKSSITLSPTEQVKLKIIWNVYIDPSVQPARFCFYGDPALGLVPASFSAPVAGGGNTGNGTIGTVAVYSGFTKTETITVTCVGQTSGNNFAVSGNISGALGTFHVAAASTSTANFVSPEITFTATQGTVQWANGDTFTIATVASNYA